MGLQPGKHTCDSGRGLPPGDGGVWKSLLDVISKALIPAPLPSSFLRLEGITECSPSILSHTHTHTHPIRSSPLRSSALEVRAGSNVESQAHSGIFFSLYIRKIFIRIFALVSVPRLWFSCLWTHFISLDMRRLWDLTVYRVLFSSLLAGLFILSYSGFCLFKFGGKESLRQSFLPLLS